MWCDDLNHLVVVAEYAVIHKRMSERNGLIMTIVTVTKDIYSHEATVATTTCRGTLPYDCFTR